MCDQYEQDNLLDFEAYQIEEFDKQHSQNSYEYGDNYPYQKGDDEIKDRKVQVEFVEEVIRFDPKDTIASGNVVITNESKASNIKGQNAINSNATSTKDEKGEHLFKKSQKVKKLQNEYRDHVETQQALKEFQDKEYQFRFIIDSFIQLNNIKQQQLETSKQSLSKIQNNRYIAIDKSDPLMHVNNNNNIRVFANQKVSKLDEYYPQEIGTILSDLQEKIKNKEDRVKEEQFYTKTLSHMEQRLILQKEDVQKLQIEYEYLNEAVEKNIVYLEEDEKETKAQNVLNICKQQYVKKAMNHVEEIHKSVMQKTMNLQEIAESDLKTEIDQYKDIKESLAEAKEILRETQEEIDYLEHQHVIKLRQQQELDSLIDHISDFNMLATVFVYDDPKKHFTHQLAFSPVLDFSVLQEDQVLKNDKKNQTKDDQSQLTQSDNIDEKRDVYNIVNNIQSIQNTQNILKQKNLMLYAIKVNKKLTEIKNELDSDEDKAQFIVNIMNQFYEAHNNNIVNLFENLETNYIYSCKQRDNLSEKIVQLEFDKKKLQEELNEFIAEAQQIKIKFLYKKKNLEIIDIDDDLDQYSHNQIISAYYTNDKFLEDYYNSSDQDNIDVYALLKQNELSTKSAFSQELEEFNKNYNTFLSASNNILSKQPILSSYKQENTIIIKIII